MSALKFLAPLLLIFAGTLIILVILYLSMTTTRALKVIMQLIDINEESDYDLHEFLPRASKLLKKIRVEEIFYRISYLSTTLERGRMSYRKEGIHKEFQRTDYQIHIGIVPEVYRGEQKPLYMITLEILFILVETDILIKIKAINEAFASFSKLQTFVLHDVKNITQFIQSLAYNLEHLEVEREQKFLDYLRESVPMLSLRASKVLGILEMDRAEMDRDAPKQQGKIDMKTLLEGLRDHYHLQCEIEGEALVVGEEYRINIIFDNIMKNIYEKSLQEAGMACSIRIGEEEGQIKVTIDDNGGPIKHIDRIFEPFNTTKRGGLGIGLYQAQSMARSAGGRISAVNNKTGVTFEVILPLAMHSVSSPQF